MKCLITGSAGQLGAELCRLLGSEAIGIDVDTIDLTNRAMVHDVLVKMAPQAIINCAAYTQVDNAEDRIDRCRAVNAGAVASLVEVCRLLDCPLVQISTDYVFTGNPPAAQPRLEGDKPIPRGVYAITKFEGEKAAATWSKHLIVRTCGLYARPSHASAKNFVKTILRLARSQTGLRVVDDQWCTPSYVPDVAQGIAFLLKHCTSRGVGWGTYHVTNRGETTWCRMAREIVRFAGLDTTVEAITTAEYPLPAPRPPYSVLDTTAYHRLDGPPMPPWQDALAAYCEELREVEKA